MKISFFTLFIASISLAVFTSCDADDVQPSGRVQFQFNHVVGNTSVRLNDSEYTNPAGESFRISMFKYYISNIQFIKADGSIYSQPNSYYLVDEADSTTKAFTLANVPEGTYTHIRFVLGVDSVRNVSGAQTGALDPINGMFWEWKTGYIFVKLEGSSSASTDSLKRIRYHIGGFQNPNNIRTVTLPVGSNLTVTDGGNTIVHWKVNVNEMLQTPNLIKFSEHSTLMFDSKTAEVADNYTDMFSIVSFENKQP